MIKLLKEQKGFLLADAVLAMLVITIAIIAIVGMFGQSAISNRASGAYAKTGNIAQKYMEIYKQQIEDSTYTVWNQASTYDSNGKRVVPISEFDQDDNNNYTISVETKVNPLGSYNVSYFDSDNANKLIQLKVSASYKDGSYKVNLVTYCLRQGY